MAQIAVQDDILQYKPMQVLHDLINDNIQDINAIRASQISFKARRWIFGELPESNDKNYPRVALLEGNITFQEWGAGQYYCSEVQGTGINKQVLRDHFAVVATFPITIGVFVKKDQRHEIEFSNGERHTVQNGKQVDYLSSKIAGLLHSNRDKFIEKNLDIRILSMPRSYQNNNWSWATNIECEIDVVFIIKTQNYSEAELIKQIDLTITANLV